jgi:hypothetical protein
MAVTRVHKLAAGARVIDTHGPDKFLTGWKWLWWLTLVLGFTLNLVYLIRCGPGIPRADH